VDFSTDPKAKKATDIIGSLKKRIECVLEKRSTTNVDYTIIQKGPCRPVLPKWWTQLRTPAGVYSDDFGASLALKSLEILT